MIFKNLYFNIIIRTLLLAGSCLLLPIVNNKYHDIIININIVIFVVLQIILLIRRLNFVNRDLISFFDSLKYDDSSVILSNEFQNQDYFRLSKRLQKVNKQILKLKEQNIQQDIYFKTVTEHATVGLLGFDENGQIKLCNKAFKELLNFKNVTKISKLNILHSDFESLLMNIAPSDQKLLKIDYNNKETQLVIRSTNFKSKNQNLKLISIQDIKNELDQKELESWQKLVQILRHEIMNSIGPISSTIDTLNELMTDSKNNKTVKIEQLNNEILEDVSSGLKIIKERNIGLQHFVDNFKSISKLPDPNFEKVKIETMFNAIKSFWKNEFASKKIDFQISINNNIDWIIIDKNQIEQVLINLIKNSLEAESSMVKISAFKNDEDKVLITVSDNGKGISQEIIDEIFMPFYTTKEQGSGIGLSLARQIMRLHNGNISVVSTQKNLSNNKQGETTFTLTF